MENSDICDKEFQDEIECKIIKIIKKDKNGNIIEETDTDGK